MRLEDAKKGQGRSRSWVTGQLLVTKVFLGKSIQEMNVVQARRAIKEGGLPAASGGAAGGAKAEQVRILPEMYPDHNSVFRLKVPTP